MKRFILFFLVFFVLRLTAQVPFGTMDSINANNINALALVHGDMWWNKSTAKPHCYYPNGTQKNITFAGSIWMSAYDNAGQLHVAAQTYRQDGNDYWPGPLDNGGNLDYATSQKWAKIWKVTAVDLQTYLSEAFHTSVNVPASILDWPAKGNTFATGNGGVPLAIEKEMAPFVDKDGDGVYEPLKGDYPDIRGEQTLWWVFCDNGPAHNQTSATPLKVEVHAMSYAFKRNTLIDDVVYYDYTIINKSSNDFHDFRWTLWNSVYLGYYLNLYNGFDSTHRMGITYHDSYDGSSGGVPANAYAIYPHIIGYTIVRSPGDFGSNYVPAGSYMYYNNDPSIIGNPTTDTEYNHYMRARYRNGAHMQYAGSDANYYAPIDPSVPGVWNECSSSNTVGSRCIVLSTNSFDLKAGDKARVVMALVVDSMGGYCPSINFNRIKEVADTAWGVYHSLPDAVIEPTQSPMVKSIVIYPNPATDKLVIDGSAIDHDVQVKIYNVLGQVVDVALCKHGLKNTVDVSNYPTGTYIVSYPQSGLDKKAMFMKE